MEVKREYIKTHATKTGNLMKDGDFSALIGRACTATELTRTFNTVYGKLVTCQEYGKVLSAMKGGVYTSSRVNKMARARKINSFMICGITFILLDWEEYEIYRAINTEHRQKVDDVDTRKRLLWQPKNKFESDNFRMDRNQYEQWWRDGKIGGEEWDRFFTDVMPKYEDKFMADSIGEWLAGCGYHADPSSKDGIVRRVRYRSSLLWKEYCDWATEHGYVPKYIREFSIRLAENGFQRRYGGGRSFDVFEMGSDEVDSVAIGVLKERSERMIESQMKEIERMAEIHAAKREQMEERMMIPDDKEWLLEVEAGRYKAAKLYVEYEMWCMDVGKQSLGKKGFYDWICEQDGWSRETRGGNLWMEKKNHHTK